MLKKEELEELWICKDCKMFLENYPVPGFHFCFERDRSLTDLDGWTECYWICPRFEEKDEEK